MPSKKTKVKGKSKSATKPAATKKVSTIKVPAIKETLSQSALLTLIAETTGISKSEVKSVLETLKQIIKNSLKSGGPGKFVLPALLKAIVVKKPARAARQGTNPFTGEPMTFKAKPASKTVKIKALKQLKEIVA